MIKPTAGHSSEIKFAFLTTGYTLLMQRPNSFVLLAAALGFAKLAGIGGTAHAAVRLCEAPVSSGPVQGATENEARAAALAAWREKARAAHGERYTSWRLAADRIVKCLPGKTGGLECLARAAPCTIEQAPDRRELREKRIGV